ncbi:hypothetical protein NP233_g12565 [Leucocoprinus birnbaumii]|uniref:RNA-dependent RNA polymerase n=1 Tax=Leucocoprinus birnbaumii TaxID=56174 RepID=A0AAD5YPW9_9AGAR|nr:hypothetical protein NP233_g12565 [Leucocoprinus birnbaumii]
MVMLKQNCNNADLVKRIRDRFRERIFTWEWMPRAESEKMWKMSAKKDGKRAFMCWPGKEDHEAAPFILLKKNAVPIFALPEDEDMGINDTCLGFLDVLFWTSITLDLLAITPINKLNMAPYKVLEPNELFFEMSQPILTTVDGTGQVADWLASGDYNGDKAKLIWEPDLIKDFTNADNHFADAPNNLNEQFKTQNKKVDHFLKCVESLPSECWLLEMQNYLLGTMTGQGKVGADSRFHEYSTLVKGYHHPETKLLAYIFNTALDG